MMQDDDGLVEVIADTLFECDGMPNLTRQDIARAALAALEREGMVIVPHASDCSLYNEPALPKGTCDCWLSASPKHG
jgi:hypothetical protein